MRRRLAVVAALLGILTLAGCDAHTQTLATPKGEDLSRVRIATLDVLLDKGVDVLEAPVCRRDDGAIQCRGTTGDGTGIESVSPADDRQKITVTVGGDELFSGSIREVIEKAGRAS